MTVPAHFITFLAAHAERQPDKVALRVSAGASSPDTFTEHGYAQLHRAVVALSLQLRAIAPPGERALILVPSGAEFITAFLACLHAGIIAVPAYPPRRNRNRERVVSIHDNAEPALILTTTAFEGHVREALPDTKARVIALAGANDHGRITEPACNRLHNPHGIAFLQYTSGSTGTPKGTVISHANLLANLDAIQALFQHKPEHEVVTWLPPYHDMGLIGCLLTPLYRGMTVTLLSTDEFLRQPVRWLQVISSRQAQVSSGAPNFAWQLLAERVAEDDIAALDLSRWRVAFNGAEPVQARTLEQFAQRFVKCGFKAEAWLPCYGLAESTLLAAGRKTSSPTPSPIPVRVGKLGLPVSCGPPALDTRITIHHRETGALLEDGQEGEIHVRSPSVALGYWRNEAATAAAFPQAGTLRTGDLGSLRDDELYVTGRLKDLIIIRGRNLYPHDVETCVAACLPAALGANAIAAFEFTGNGSGTLGLLIEAPRTWVSGLRKENGEIATCVRSIREAVAESFEVAADLIAFVAPGEFPRTSSGKVQRSACREGVLTGSLPVIYRDQLTPMNNNTPASSTTADALIQWLRSFAARRLNSRLMDERRTVAPHVVLEFGNHGLFGLEVPRALGGAGLTTTDSLRVMEQLAAIDLTLALLVGLHNALGLRPVLRYGQPALRDELVPAMAGGRHLASFAISEPGAGSNPKAIETTAVRGNDGGWTIHGRKQWIGQASWAGTIVVIAKAQDVSGEHLGSVALAVPADAEGLSFGPEAMTMGMRGIVQVPVFFEDVKVDAARVLGEVGHGFEVAYDAMRIARVGLSALSLGAMKRCLQWMTTYASRRQVAGGRLADLPATQSRLAETVNATAAVEALLRAVCRWQDAGEALPEEVFLICKTTAPELLSEAADRAMQMLGARGYTENNSLTQLFRDARILRIFEGPTEALNASLGIRLRRGSDALCAWMEERQGKDAASVLRSLSEQHPTAHDVALGELASFHFLLWIVRQSDAGDCETIAWLEQRLRQLNAAACVPASVVVIDDLTARLEKEIGAFDQTLPGEDWDIDPLLRNTSVRTNEPVLVAVSPGAEPTWTATSLPAFTKIEPEAPAPNTVIEQWILDYLRSENLVNIPSLPRDATFTSLGIDSLGGASLGIEIDKTFGVRITDEMLYDYPTLQSLAAYVESRRAPDGVAPEPR